MVDSKCDKLKCEDLGHPKVNVVMESQMENNMDQNWTQQNQILFGNSVQLSENICNVGYVPMQYYPQIYPIMGSTGV